MLALWLAVMVLSLAVGVLIGRVRTLRAELADVTAERDSIDAVMMPFHWRRSA